MSGSYVTIPDDLFPWLAWTLNARDELAQLAGVSVLEAAGAGRQDTTR